MVWSLGGRDGEVHDDVHGPASSDAGRGANGTGRLRRHLRAGEALQDGTPSSRAFETPYHFPDDVIYEWPPYEPCDGPGTDVEDSHMDHDCGASSYLNAK